MKEVHKKLLLAVTKSNWGGAQRYVHDLAVYFSQQEGYEVVVAAGGNGVLLTKLKERGIRTISIPSLERNIGFVKEIRASLALLRILLTEKPDILHLNSSKIGLVGTILGRIVMVPKILFTCHGWPFNETRPLLQKMVFRALGMLTVLFSHRTIAVSQSIIKGLRAPNYITKKMKLIYVGIEKPTLYEDGRFFTEYAKEKSQGVQLVSVGELHASKGYDRALMALASCKHLPWTYHIIGTGEKKLYLEGLIKNLDLSERVVLHGFIENASSYLNSFDLFLFPSRTEALGLVAIEALYSKLPIIASNAGGIPEVLFDDPYTKLIDCSDAKIFKEAMLSSLQKKIQVDETKRPGRLRFDPLFMFAATKKVYD